MPNFLEKITITHKLVRETRYKDHGLARTTYKLWVPKTIEPTDVWILGERTLSNGQRDWNSEYIAYYPKEYIKALLVIKDENTNPFYILAESVEVNNA